MIEKEFNNEFRFTLYQGNVIYCDVIFNANYFNPVTRYSVDIRDILPKIITKLQKTLSKKSYDTVFSDDLDFYSYYCKKLSSYSKDVIDNIKYNPQVIVQQIEDKIIKGVEFKFGLYINDKPIVERLFYVDGFNPVSRWSNDIVLIFREIVNSIIDKLKNEDIKNIWDDYDLINIKGLTITQIRELTPQKRDELLYSIKK